MIMSSAIDKLTDDRCDPSSRAVWEDAVLQSGARPTRLGVAVAIYAADIDDDAEADADADDAADAGDAADADTDIDDADADDDDAADADATDGDNDIAIDVDVEADATDIGDDDVDADVEIREANARIINILNGDLDMRDGLKLIQIPGGRYGYRVTIVGYMRRIGGDEWELLPGARVVVRTSGQRRRGLDSLANEGPMTDHRLGAPWKGSENLHRLRLSRVKPASHAAWDAHVSRPVDFVEAE